MKIADDTINILKNFSTINEGIMIRKGKVLETISKEKNILARAEVADEFSEELGLYDINSFLGTLSMNGNEIEFNGTTDVIIKGFNGKSKTTWRKTPENMIVVPPNKLPKILNTLDTFSSNILPSKPCLCKYEQSFSTRTTQRNLAFSDS